MRFSKTIIALASLCSLPVMAELNVDVSGFTRAYFTDVSGEPSWLARGTGQTRFDGQDKYELGEALVELDLGFGSGFSAHMVAHHYLDPQVNTGFTEAFVKYAPLLSPDYKLTVRAGLFYPEMSYENTGPGWTSRYTYSYSAINSWIAEELRVPGLEAKLQFAGKTRKSPHKLALIGALYKGNDTLGTMLAWRGWGIHDRQSVANETVFFAKYPSIGPGARVERQAAWVEPFRELDGRYGYYVGGEWDYKRQSRMRYYYYDNNGDYTAPWQRGGQKIWDTQFHSLAWQYRFDNQWRLLTQYMTGKTRLGKRVVKIDFDAWYAMVNYRTGPHSASVRFDKFKTVDKDDWATDLNDGDGTGVTLAYKYKLSDMAAVGIEYLDMDTTRVNRLQWQGRSADVDQKQWLLGVELRF